MKPTLSMGKISKTFVLVLTIVISMPCLTLITIYPANAQTIPVPSIPQFTIKFVNASYSITTTNAYTGQSETQEVSNNSIEITIKNQPFDYSNNGLTYQLYFNIRAKPHFGENWTEVYPIENGTSKYNGGVNFSYAEYIEPDSPIQSSSEATSVTFYVVPTTFYGSTTFVGYQIQRYNSGGIEGSPYNETFLNDVPNGAQLDFQVQALVGHNSTMWYNSNPFYAGIGGYIPAVAYDSASGWSNTQTITIGEMASTSPTPTPTVPEFSWLVTVPLLLSVFSIAVILRHRKTNKLSN